MNNDRISKLESSRALKKKVFAKGIWKNYAIVPPAIVLFAGILGAVYLLNINQLISWAVVPFALIFILGTIWLKAVRRFLINNKISKANEFLVCLAIPFEGSGKSSTLLFSTGKNRNNKYYLEKEKKDMAENTRLPKPGRKAIRIGASELYLIHLPWTHKFAGPPQKEYRLIYAGVEQVYFLNQREIDSVH
jgi:hypothetical protein